VENKYPIDLNGKTYQLSEEQIGDLIKRRMKKSKVIVSAFQKYGLPMDILDQLKVTICPLGGEKKYAETDGEIMRLSEEIFRKGNFYSDFFFVPIHEIFHFVNRNCEKNGMKIKERESEDFSNFLDDPEEVEGFILSMAYEIESHGDLDLLYNRIYPRLEFHFSSPIYARDCFKKMLEEAIKIYKNC